MSKVSKTKKLKRKTELRKADEAFSKYVRLRDADENGMCRCITCGKSYHWKSIHAGHFRRRSKTPTRYDERNVNAQCTGCNTFRGGKEYEHGLAIDEKYGTPTSLELFDLSQKDMKLSAYDLSEIAANYRQKAREIAKIKGIEL